MACTPTQLTTAIYATKEYGSHVPERYAEPLVRVVQHMTEREGADVVVLGCTELPLVMQGCAR